LAVRLGPWKALGEFVTPQVTYSTHALTRARSDGWPRNAFERDRQRDAILAQAGYRVLRFSHRQVTREPAQVAAALRSSA
jgi:hypothetical protein